MSDDRPISEMYRLVARKWVDADKAASLMEETKSVVLSEMVNKVVVENLGFPVNRAELLAKCSPEYKEFITQMVEHRSSANLLKVQMRYIEMQFSEQQSAEATARSEKRL
jgi:hypothetical protein